VNIFILRMKRIYRQSTFLYTYTGVYKTRIDLKKMKGVVTLPFRPINKKELEDAISFFSENYNQRHVAVAKYGQMKDWNTELITDMSYLFEGFRFLNDDDDNISNWNVSNVISMRELFYGCISFNQPLNNWNVSKVTDMSQLFAFCESFNQPLNDWGDKVSEVENMYRLFHFCKTFNQPLNNWNVSNVTDMSQLFSNCLSFNQPLNDWGDKVSNVRNMAYMFEYCITFNQPLNNWNVSKVKNMKEMFQYCESFNKPLNDWGDKVSNVRNMESMFEYCITFNQPLNNWNINEDTTNIKDMFEDCTNMEPRNAPGHQ
jgi:surface protein